MTINKTAEGSKMTMAIEGRLDTTTAPKLETEINALTGVTELVLDIEKLEYISSAGLRVLLGAHKKLHGGLTIAHVSADVMEIFEVTGFSDILTIA